MSHYRVAVHDGCKRLFQARPVTVAQAWRLVGQAD